MSGFGNLHAPPAEREHLRLKGQAVHASLLIKGGKDVLFGSHDDPIAGA
jgi:hypothetical protein